MAGYAPEMNIQLLNTRYNDENHRALKANDKSAIASLGGYSAFASHRNIDPIIDLKHQLTRLCFKAYPGNKDCEAVTITGIDIISETTGRLVVASRNLNEVGIKPMDDQSSLTLREESTNGIDPCQDFAPKKLEWIEGEEILDVIDRTSMELGGSLLLFPGEKYTMMLHYRQKVASYVGAPDEKIVNYTGKYTLRP
jgi:hypothetical protein